MKVKSEYPVITLGKLAEKIDYGFSASATDVGDGPKFLRITDIQDDHVNWSTVPLCEADKQDTIKYALAEGDIVFARTGATTGKSYLIRHCPQNSIFASYLIRVRPSKDVDSGYLSRFFQTSSYWRQINLNTSGTAQGGVNATKLKTLLVPLPPLEEQRKIAAILDKADGVRRKRKEAIRLTDELLKSTFLEMFGDPVTNPKGWEVRELGDCVKDIESGWSPKCDTRQAEPEEWGVLKLGAVTYGHFNPDENKAMLPDDVPRQELEIKTGDLLVTRKNTYELVGASAFVQMTRPKLMLPDLIFRLRLIDGIDPVYVWQTLSQKTMRLKLSGLAGGTAGSMPNISKARLRTLPFPVPPQLLQLKYREIFNQFWLKKEHQKESEEISENLFNSLLQKAFRGEL